MYEEHHKCYRITDIDYLFEIRSAVMYKTITFEI